MFCSLIQRGCEICFGQKACDRHYLFKANLGPSFNEAILVIGSVAVIVVVLQWLAHSPFLGKDAGSNLGRSNCL